MAIETRKALQEHLQWGLQVELSTIPTYLYSMYSIENEHAAPFNLIRSIVVEEMLHATLIANVLVAVGGQPRFYDEAIIPAYPKPLPHHTPEILLNLEECTPEVVERVFAEIEKPKTVEGVPQDDNYETIEQFYLAIEQALERLDEEQSLFDPDSTGRQMSDPRYYSPVEYDAEDSGGLFPVVDCDQRNKRSISSSTRERVTAPTTDMPTRITKSSPTTTNSSRSLTARIRLAPHDQC